MKLFLIRHGETVDNLAQLYAGVTDSALSSHGVLQTRRLGSHFASAGLRFTKIFSSDLQRAFKTAEAIRLAQPPQNEWNPPQVHGLEILREQDFGSMEGVTYMSRYKAPAGRGESSKSGENVGFKEMESKESMIGRMNTFLDESLLPVIAEDPEKDILVEDVVAIVSHGVILSVLWGCLLNRFDPRSVLPTQRALEQSGGSYNHNIRWANTGYSELRISRKLDQRVKQDDVSVIPKSLSALDADRKLVAWNLSIRSINVRDHLAGLKRTGGGIGSSKSDEGQSKIEAFFKKNNTSQIDRD
ncbi:MAG: hypothetical protein M1813_000231 [Trichoglossum hirsutum]|nr:MAG: hypothetical protein M1813_000231 [Trichoglossum hirsutum]